MYVPPLPKSFETFMTSLGTQIMLPHQFVECLDHIKMLVELLYLGGQTSNMENIK